MKSLRYQSGLSSIVWLTIILVGGFFAICIFKLVPLYVDNIYITNGLKSLSDLDKGATGYREVSRRDIESHMTNFFTVNNLRGDFTKSLDVDMGRDSFQVNMNYERRVPLFYNIEVVLSFENQFDSRRPHECCKPQAIDVTD